MELTCGECKKKFNLQAEKVKWDNSSGYHGFIEHFKRNPLCGECYWAGEETAMKEEEEFLRGNE